MNATTVTGTLRHVAAHTSGGVIAVLAHPEVRLQILIPEHLLGGDLVVNGAYVTADLTGLDSETSQVTAIREAAR